MNDLTSSFLTNIVSPLMLPIFALATLCIIAGVRPEPVVSGFLSIGAAVVSGFFRLLGMLLGALLRIPQKPPGRRYPPSRRG